MKGPLFGGDSPLYSQERPKKSLKMELGIRFSATMMLRGAGIWAGYGEKSVRKLTEFPENLAVSCALGVRLAKRGKRGINGRKRGKNGGGNRRARWIFRQVSGWIVSEIEQFFVKIGPRFCAFRARSVCVCVSGALSVRFAKRGKSG